MQKLKMGDANFQDLDSEGYITDVSFQKYNWPSGNMSEGKKYFSGKHKLYGYKANISVYPISHCVGCTKHFPDALSDLEFF